MHDTHIRKKPTDSHPVNLALHPGLSLPPAHHIRTHSCKRPLSPMQFSFECEGFSDRETKDLLGQAADLELTDGSSDRFVLIQSGGPLPRTLTAHETQVLRKSDEAYLLEVLEGSGFLIASGYRGIIHGLERLKQWTRLPEAERFPVTILDLPVLEVRGMNRDDAEDWTLEYWRRTVAFARERFHNLLAISVELPVAALAAADTDKFENFITRYREIDGLCTRAGIRLVPMVYNIDHMMGQMLHAAGRDDLTEARERRRLRFDSDEAWELALDFMVRTLSAMTPPAFALWVSEVAHELYGDERLSEEDQFQREAWFGAELLRRLRKNLPEITFVNILSQASRDRVDIFTEICRDLPVEYVHYDGEWTYPEGKEEPLTTHSVRRSMESGLPWIAKPRWSGVGYYGLPYLKVERIFRDAMECVREGYRGIFPNASRWQSVPWNTILGSAIAWGGARGSLPALVNAILYFDQETRASVDDVLEIEKIWKRICGINKPTNEEFTPRLGGIRNVGGDFIHAVREAATNPEFQITRFEEAFLMGCWREHRHWLGQKMETLARLRGIFCPCAEGSRVWSASIESLEIFTRLIAHSLAACHIINREFGPDTAKGPWRAWRPLVALHITSAREAMMELAEFMPLDNSNCLREGDLFDPPPGFGGTMPDHLKKLAADCDVILEKLRDPDAFSALNASQGFEGFYPPTGLYSEADWPTRFSGLDA